MCGPFDPSSIPHMSVIARTALFLSAFIPVFPLLAIRVWPANQALAAAFLGVAAAISIVALLTYRLLGRGAIRQVAVDAADSHAESLVGFIFGYLVPPTLIDGRDSYVVAVNALAFVFLVVVAVRSQLVFLNPVLSFLGQHVFTVELKSPNGATTETVVLLVNTADVRKGTRLEIRGATGPIQRARVIN